MIYLKACNNLEENCSCLWKRLLRSGSGAYIAGTTDQIITNYSAQCKEMNYAKKICVLAWWVHESLFLFHKKLTHSTHKYYLFWRNSTLYIAAACCDFVCQFLCCHSLQFLNFICCPCPLACSKCASCCGNGGSMQKSLALVFFQLNGFELHWYNRLAVCVCVCVCVCGWW